VQTRAGLSFGAIDKGSLTVVRQRPNDRPASDDRFRVARVRWSVGHPSSGITELEVTRYLVARRCR
jgi:hypothetical protein